MGEKGPKALGFMKFSEIAVDWLGCHQRRKFLNRTGSSASYVGGSSKKLSVAGSPRATDRPAPDRPAVAQQPPDCPRPAPARPPERLPATARPPARPTARPSDRQLARPTARPAPARLPA